MRLIQGRRVVGIFASLALVLGACTTQSGPSTQTTQPGGSAQPTGPKAAPVERLVITLSKPSFDEITPWSYGHRDLVHVATAMETLIGLDVNGKYVPQLATKWTMSPDGKAWTVDLRQGVKFHRDYGEFTAKDVVQSWELMRAKEAKSSYRSVWVDVVTKIDVVNDYQVILRAAVPSPDLPFFLSGSGDLLIMSKAQFDAEGVKGMGQRLVGTGPYQMVEAKLGEYDLFERVPYKHWRVAEPVYKQIQLRYVREEATRLAMLLSGEASMAELPQDLLSTAEQRGKKIAIGELGASPSWLQIGGLWYGTGDKEYSPSKPWTAPGETGRLVRQAMNKAIDRDALNKAIFRGTGELLRVLPFRETSLGWNPDWDKRWKDMYGYDPGQAKALLAKAGYPNGFSVKMWGTHQLSGFSELPQLAEAIGVQLGKVGIKAEITNADFSVVREAYRTKRTTDFIFPISSDERPVQENLRGFFSPEGNLKGYHSDKFVSTYKTVTQTLDETERGRLLKTIGDEFYEQFVNIPLFWLRLQLAYDPKIIGQYKFPGNGGSMYSHLETITAP